MSTGVTTVRRGFGIRHVRSRSTCPQYDSFFTRIAHHENVSPLERVSIRDRDSHTKALAVLPVMIVVAGTSAILVRYSTAPSSIKVAYRLAFATLGFVPLALLYYREDFRRFGRRDTVLAGVSGIILGIHYLFWFRSLDFTSVAASTTLAQTQTIFVVILAYVLLSETITLRTVLGVVVAFAGVIVMSIGGATGGPVFAGADPVFGNALATSAGVLFAFYLVISRSVRQRIGVIPYVTVVHVFATATTFAFAAATGESIALSSYPHHEWALFFAMGLGPSFVAQTLSNWSLRYVKSSVVSVAYLGVPITSSVLALVLLAEMPGVGTIVGGALTLLGIYVTIRRG